VLEIYLVDDGCTDGTGDAVREQFPKVNVVQGNGKLYWCGGMRLAWTEAMKKHYDYYLWLNDDTHIYKKTIHRLIDIAEALTKREGVPVIVAGATCEPDSNVCTYSGVHINGFLRKPVFTKIIPLNHPQRCDTSNGNCVLVPRDVAYLVGNLSKSFTHGMGDYDYGLRARDIGVQCWVAGDYIGACSGPTTTRNLFDPTLTVRERLVAINKPTGLPPLREWMIFTWRHAGWLWPLCWLRSLTRALLPQLWVQLREKK
jgi:GT2 family glycosyltransferase